MLITFEDITTEKLSEIFQNAGLECDVDEDDNEVYLHGGDLPFPIWVKIDTERKYLMLKTWLKVQDGAPLDQLPEFLQKLNEMILVQFTSCVYEDGRAYVNGFHWIYTSFGILVPQLVLTARKFSAIFIEGIKTHDPEDVFFS